MVSVNVKQHLTKTKTERAELRSCVKVEVAVLGSATQRVLISSLCGRKATLNSNSLTACSQVSHWTVRTRAPNSREKCMEAEIPADRVTLN